MIIIKKYILILIVILLLIFSACGRLSPTKIAADEVRVSSLISGSPIKIVDEKVVKELTESYNSLKVKKIEDNLDLESKINIVFYKDGKEKAAVTIDENDYLYLYRDSNTRYKIVGGNFSYDHIKELYDNNK